MKYRSDIDGLRAIAVIVVLFSHVGITTFSGGYIGVDVFFVISGFLITTIITEEIRQGDFSIVRFYERRIRRIFPALFMMMLVTTIIAFFIFLPIHFKDYGQSMVAATLFVSNVLFWKEAGYFSEASDTKPLLHTWSLGVEEQFYIFFPILLLLLYRYFKGRWSAWIASLGILSFIISVYGLQVRPTGTFFLLPTRAWELFLGALLALRIFPEIKNKRISNNLSLLGSVFILYAVFMFSDTTPFPGMNALLPVLGAFLIIYSGTYYPTIVSKALSLHAIVFIGLISYSLYLWHWPIIAFYKYYMLRDLFNYEIIIIIAISFILAIFSWKYIETPFRKKIIFQHRKKLFIFVFLIMGLAVSIGAWLHISKGYPQRLDESIRKSIVDNELAMTKWDYPDKYNNFKNTLNQASDMNYYRIGRDKKGKILFWGDSHIGMLFPAIKELFDTTNTKHQAILGTSGRCLPVRDFNRIENGYFCDRFNNLLFNKAMDDDIDIVVIGSRWDYNGNRLRNVQCQKEDCSDVLSLDTVEKKLKTDIKELIEKGKKVYIILPFPRYNYSVPLTLEKRYLFDKKEEPALSHKLYKSYSLLNKIDEMLISISRETGAKILDPKKVLCKGDECNYEKEGISIYRDSSHLNTDGALLMTDMLRQILTKEDENERE